MDTKAPMPMNHAEKIAAMRQHMLVAGVTPSTWAPPLWRLLWRFGVQLPPPLFIGFWPALLGMGSFFGVFWGLFMWLLLWRSQQMPVLVCVSAAFISGSLFGLFMAAYYRHLARKHRLPAWSEYTGAAN